jgi:hypothetical protein
MHYRVVVSLLALILAACSISNESATIGSYRLVRPQERETINLKADHSYVRIFGDSTGTTQTEKGIWKFEILGKNNSYISFHAVDPPSDALLVKPIENWFGTIYLGADEEGAKLYRKVN